MDVVSTYSVKIKHYNHIFNDTVSIYREAVDFLIKVCLTEWNGLFVISSDLSRQQYVERLCHKTSANPIVKYNSFDKKFYKFPSYLRRSAITDAIGKVSSYKSNHAKWESADMEKYTTVIYLLHTI